MKREKQQEFATAWRGKIKKGLIINNKCMISAHAGHRSAAVVVVVVAVTVHDAKYDTV